MEIKRGNFKNICLMIMFLFLTVLLISPVYGLGASISNQYLAIDEGERGCISYGIFNSGEYDVSVSVSVGNQLEDLVFSAPTVTEISASTRPDLAVPIEVCFDAPDNIYDRECSGEDRSYGGFVLFSQAADSSGGATGSATALAVSAPLIIDITCSPEEGFSFGNIYLILAVVLLVIVVILLIVKKNQSRG